MYRYNTERQGRINKRNWDETMQSFTFYELYKHGATIKEIANKHGVSEEKVKRLVERRERIDKMNK